MGILKTPVAVPLLAILLVAGSSFSWAADTARSRPDSPLDKAAQAVDAGDYGQAVPTLEEIVESDPTSADALNYLGYSHRKLGQYEIAKTYYLRALEVDPEHKGANEYLGELYLEQGDLAAAEERLEVLDDACGFFGCEEYDELEEKIEAFRSSNQQS
ncbi:MAG: tetratricopeptide repeat protein [Alphaproteobacteria bacterium]|nr:tetratricopeptide repeat protein [Alphaproteobacteria bacterium]